MVEGPVKDREPVMGTAFTGHVGKLTWMGFGPSPVAGFVFYAKPSQRRWLSLKVKSA